MPYGIVIFTAAIAGIALHEANDTILDFLNNFRITEFEESVSKHGDDGNGHKGWDRYVIDFNRGAGEDYYVYNPTTKSLVKVSSPKGRLLIDDPNFFKNDLNAIQREKEQNENWYWGLLNTFTSPFKDLAENTKDSYEKVKEFFKKE